MFNSFISIVTVVNDQEEVQNLSALLSNASKVLSDDFQDHEFVVVNNSIYGLEDELKELPEQIRKHIFLINLSKVIDVNNAIVAGYDKANGDYIILWEPAFSEQQNLIKGLFEKAQTGKDIVYLRSKREEGFLKNVLISLFYWLLRRFSDVQVDKQAHDSRIISRRALNAILKMRENLRFTKGIYSLVGYKNDYIETSVSIRHKESFGQMLKKSFVALTSFTNILRVGLSWMLVISILFFLGVSTNALLVKFQQVDIFGYPQESVPGWTFLVILISVVFIFLSINLYLMGFYLTHIYSEIKQRPLYIIESIKRL